MRKTTKAAIALLMSLVVVFGMTCTSFAAAGYKDVNRENIDAKSIKSIKFIKKHGGFKGVFTGKKFYPNKKMTRRQYLLVLNNLYPGKVKITMNDLRKANKPVTEKYVTSKMVKLAADGYGMKITWKGGKKKLSRASVCNYIRSFAKFDSAFTLK
ncbi:hypothetical protein IKF28_03525 [Candidatus Saccharibacteria bacterium]|nr:hypothetical protein [Candidatus Saccharibacteria bacterium]MBR3122481.1 hypothetical protein [Candidatus Saccharibacteria bacterium]